MFFARVAENCVQGINELLTKEVEGKHAGHIGLLVMSFRRNGQGHDEQGVKGASRTNRAPSRNAKGRNTPSLRSVTWDAARQPPLGSSKFGLMTSSIGGTVR